MVELNTGLLVDIGGWPALKEARILLEQGRVTDVRREGAVVRGRVRGAEKIHDAQIVLGDRIASVEVKCTCVESRRSGRVCAHALAVGLALLRPAPNIASPSAPVAKDSSLIEKTPEAASRDKHPEIEVRIDGALSGLTLELIGAARAEKQIVEEVQAAGFKPARGGSFSLISEKNVAGFLANTLPRWRRDWNVTFGERLKSTLEQIDIAEPKFSLRAGSGEEWLSLDLQLAVNGKPIALDAAEVQRWLQTGQSHTRTADKRVLLVPTEAWGEMQEVLADCAVEQEPGKLRVARTYAPYLAGALTGQGFWMERNDAAESAPPDVAARLDPKLWAQLRPYQAEGVAWMAVLAQRGMHGLLADDGVPPS